MQKENKIIQSFSSREYNFKIDIGSDEIIGAAGENCASNGTHSYSNTISDEILKLIVNNFHVFVQIHCVFFSSSEQNLAQSLSFHKTNLTSLVLWIVIYDS